MADMTDAEVIAYLRDTVNGTNALPVDALTDWLGTEYPCASVQQLAGTSLLTRFIGGGGIGEMPFAVLLKVGGMDTASRVNASASLLALATALEAMRAHDDPVMDIRAESTPVLSERDDLGAETWRAQFVVRLHRRA